MARIEFSKRAAEEISAMDRITSFLILGWIKRRLLPLDDPRSIGESLGGGKRWQYRIGDYRLLSRTGGKKTVILAVTHGCTLPSHSS